MRAIVNEHEKVTHEHFGVGIKYEPTTEQRPRPRLRSLFVHRVLELADEASSDRVGGPLNSMG
jgi:hypothetical protein